MVKIGLAARCLLAVGFVAAYALPVWAAGEWEWTAGQGWVRGAGVARPTPKEQLNYAYSLEQRGEFMDASRNYFLLIQNFPDSQEAGVGLQRLARCLYEMENYYTSYKAIEQVIETYPNTGRMSDLVEIELRIAKKMMLSETPDILSDRHGNARDFNIRRALEIVDAVIKHDPYGPVAAEAYLVKGEGLLFVNDVQGARAAFETIRDEFSRSDYLERAKLGLLTCDSLTGQATPQEWQEQAQVVREAERERGRSRDELDALDDVEESIRQLAEIEAAKMMEQAEQYRRMGTKAAVDSSRFLYREIARRYPGTPQAEEAMEKLGTVRSPKEPGRIARTIRNINLNPFTFGRDPEPPWIVPQMDPEDMVMVDAGLGPIAGVPETAAPFTSGAAGVRPAALRDAMPEPESPNLTVAAAPTPAPSFIGGTQDPQPGFGPGGQTPTAAPMPPPMPPSYDAAPSNPNPLPTISEADLVGVPAGSFNSLGGGSQLPPPPAYVPAPQTPQTPQATPQTPQMVPSPMATTTFPPEPPSLGAATSYHTPYSDLIGPAKRSEPTYYQPLQPDYASAYDPYQGQPQQYYPSAPQYSPPQLPVQPAQPIYAEAPPVYLEPQSVYPVPQPSYQAQPFYQPAPQPVYQPAPQPVYQEPYPANSLPPPAVPYGSQGGGGWTMGEDFR